MVCQASQLAVISVSRAAQARTPGSEVCRSARPSFGVLVRPLCARSARACPGSNKWPRLPFFIGKRGQRRGRDPPAGGARGGASGRHQAGAGAVAPESRPQAAGAPAVASSGGRTRALQFTGRLSCPVPPKALFEWLGWSGSRIKGWRCTAPPAGWVDLPERGEGKALPATARPVQGRELLTRKSFQSAA